MADSEKPPAASDDPAVAEDAADGDPVDASPVGGADAVGGNDAVEGTEQIEKRLDEAAESLERATGDGVDPDADMQPFELGDLQPGESGDATQPIELIGEVEMDLRIELGRTKMKLQDVLRLRPGSVVALDKLAGDPVDVYANGRLIARGEVLVMNDNFCIRVTELVGD